MTRVSMEHTINCHGTFEFFDQIFAIFINFLFSFIFSPFSRVSVCVIIIPVCERCTNSMLCAMHFGHFDAEMWTSYTHTNTKWKCHDGEQTPEPKIKIHFPELIQLCQQNSPNINSAHHKMAHTTFCPHFQMRIHTHLTRICE